MPRFEPFAGLRYAEGPVRLDDVVAPPYDVISPDDQAALERRSPYNVVRIELPRDPGDGTDRYQAAARHLSEWREDRVLVRDPAPALYGYEMRFHDEAGRPRHTLGVIGALGLEPPGAGGGILPHERTMPKPKGDRLDLLRACRANTSPIWGLSLTDGLAALIQVPDGDGACTDLDGVVHRCWPITDEATIGAVTAAVASSPVVIADGHHRLETALAYQAERRSEAGAGRHDLVMALVVELADEQLTVRAIHRLISGLPAGFDILGALAPWFEATPAPPPDASVGDRMVEAGALGLFTERGSWLLRPTRELEAVVEDGLDSSRVEAALAALPGHELTYQHGWELATAAVTKGEAQAAILLRPATVRQIAATGHGGARMPPKTTFFWPKPRTGMVLREV